MDSKKPGGTSLIKINLPGQKTLGSKNISLNVSKVTEGALDRSMKAQQPSGDSAFRAFEMAQNFERQRADRQQKVTMESLFESDEEDKDRPRYSLLESKRAKPLTVKKGPFSPGKVEPTESESAYKRNSALREQRE